MDTIVGPVFDAVSCANGGKSMWPRLRDKLFAFTGATNPFECSLYHTEFMDSLLEQCDDDDVKAVVRSLFIQNDSATPLGLECSGAAFLRLRPMSDLSEAEFAHAKETLVSASESSEQELVGKILDLLREPPAVYDEGTVGRLVVQPAADVSGGRIPVGSAATIQGPVPAGTLLPYIYSAVYSGKETTESWLWESVATVLLGELGLPDTPAVRAELYKSHYGRQCMVEACSYDVTGFARPAAGKEQVTWNGLGIFFHSTLGAMNDPRGCESHLSYLQSRLSDRAFMAQQPEPRAEAEDTWVRANVLGHPAKEGVEQLMVDCSLQFVSVGGILPIVVAVAQADIPSGVHEACVSYGDGYWSFRAYFDSDIPWLPLYRRVAHAPAQGDAQLPLASAGWLEVTDLGWSSSTTQHIQAASKAVLARAREVYAASFTNAPTPLHPACANPACLIGKVGPHELICGSSHNSRADAPTDDMLVLLTSALSNSSHMAPVYALPTAVFVPDLWFPSLVEGEHHPGSFVLWPTDYFRDHPDVTRVDPLEATDEARTCQLAVACLSSSLQTLAGADVPCVQVLRFPSVEHARLLLRFAFDPVINGRAGDDGSRTSSSLGYGGPWSPERLAEQNYGTRGCVCLNDRDVSPAYMSAFLACLQAVATVLLNHSSHGKGKGKAKVRQASGAVPESDLLDSAQDATEKAVAELDSASQRFLSSVVGGVACAHAKIEYAGHSRRARNQVLNLFKAGQLDALTLQPVPASSLCLRWEDVSFRSGQSVLLPGEDVLLRMGARLQAAVDGHWLGVAFMARHR